MTTIQEHRAREARLVTTVCALIDAAGFTAAVIPGAEQAITVALIAVAAVAVLAVVARMVARRVRERREDREDALIAAAWHADQRRPDRQGVA